MKFIESTSEQLGIIRGGYIGPSPQQFDTGREDADLLLDMVYGSIGDGHDHRTLLNVLNSGLKIARRYMASAEWDALCVRSKSHPLIALLKQDPFLCRVNEKPRGYAGDAVMIDLIYGTGDCRAIVGAATPFGQSIYATTSESAASVGVRQRRALLAERIDAVANAVASPTIFAVAAGHLREAQLSKAFADGRIGRWIALDQDCESIAEIERSLPGKIETITHSINAILKGEYCVHDVDYIYSAGLYDYLPQAVAIRLSRKLGAMLRPGGRLLFANFADDIWDAGFMEAVMDWKLILRSAQDMERIAAALGDGFAAVNWTSSNGAIRYCELTRL